MLKKTKVIVGTAAAVAVLGGVGGGIALADTTTPTTPSTPAPGAAAPAHHGKPRAWASRVEHGEFTVGGKQTRVVAVQRGQVQAVSPTSITVRSADGFTATYPVDSATKVRKNNQASSISQVATNDRVTLLATKGGPVTHLADSGPAK
ncbi:MAG TPA: hypothetical protein VJ870_15145 [Amycolatopsis sp.]|nr:hypothetical protein [Amycolatopsis sp.]